MILLDSIDAHGGQQSWPIDQRDEYGNILVDVLRWGWMTYALGSESDNLPAFVVLTDPTGLPVLGVENWQSGWLPSLYQGTVARSKEPRIQNLDPPKILEGSINGSS